MSVKVNEPVSLSILLSEASSLFEQIGVIDKPQLLVKQKDSWPVERNLEDIAIDKSYFEGVIEIPSYAKVFVLVFNAGDSQWLDEEEGFWTYFEAGSDPYPSFFLMTILAIAYSRPTKSNIIDNALLLGEDRNVSVDDVLRKIRSNTAQDFTSYSTHVCQEFGV